MSDTADFGPIPEGVILVQEEPLSMLFGKWAAWMIVMALFVIILVYLSNYFVRKDEGFRKKGIKKSNLAMLREGMTEGHTVKSHDLFNMYHM